MASPADPYYGANLARVHDLGFGAHADACASGILELLEPVLRRGGLVLELGCGSGALTRHLVRAGHRVVATDASPAMLELARPNLGGAAEIRRLVLPDEEVAPADAVVSVGHVLSYLPDEAAIRRALQRIARALRPGGVLALDLCDLRWGEVRQGAAPFVRVEDDWALVTRYSAPGPALFVREITTFLREGEGWTRDDERHANVLVDSSTVPLLLARHGVKATVEQRIGEHVLPDGLVAVLGRSA